MTRRLKVDRVLSSIEDHLRQQTAATLADLSPAKPSGRRTVRLKGAHARRVHK